MTANTLVLNKGGTPVSIVKSRRAITLVNSQKAVVMAVYQGTLIRSSGPGVDMGCEWLTKSHNTVISMPIPAVIRCTKSEHVPKRYTNVLPFTRKNVYLRDHGCCMYCGKKVSINTFSFDHVTPRCLGGETSWENIVVACLRCNGLKGNKPVGKFKAPLRKPYAPKLDKAAPSQLVSRTVGEIPHETWLDYIYWNVILED